MIPPHWFALILSRLFCGSTGGQCSRESYLLSFDGKDNWIVFVWSVGWACLTRGVSRGKRCTWEFRSCTSENNFIRRRDACLLAITLWTFADNSLKGWWCWPFSRMLSEMITTSWKKREDWVVRCSLQSRSVSTQIRGVWSSCLEFLKRFHLYNSTEKMLDVKGIV